MAGQVPYEIWAVNSSGKEFFLTSFISATFLSDNDAKTEAIATLQDIIDKINTPGSDTIEVRPGLISPDQVHTRRRLREDELDS